VRGWTVRKRSAGSPLRYTTCHCAVSPPGKRSSGISSISSANRFLLSLLASWYSSPHHFEASQTSDTRKRTALQRVAIFQRPRPALAGDDAALGVEIDEDVLLAAPAFADQPSLQRERPVVVETRMADEQS
jgi:hypothetical protein